MQQGSAIFRLARAGALLGALLAAGVASALMLAAVTDAAGPPAFTPPTNTVSSISVSTVNAAITSTITPSTTSAVVGVPFTLSIDVLDKSVTVTNNPNFAFSESISGFTAAVVCTLGGLGVGATDLVVVTLAAVKPGTGRLLAAVSGQAADPVPGNNSGSVTVSVPKKPKRKL